MIRKKHFRTLLAQLRGAKKLKKQNKPFFVNDTISSLTEVSLGLDKNDFPGVLVGSHGSKAEILLRQMLLGNYRKMYSVVMQSIGNGKPSSMPLPSAWVEHLVNNGVACSTFYCQVRLFIFILRRMAIGFIKFLFLLFPVRNLRYPGCPYVVFVDLLQKNLPLSGCEKSYDIISWYKKSIIRKTDIGKIWAQAKVEKRYAGPDDLVVARSIFPKLGSLSKYVLFFFKNTLALFVSVIGVLRGKWWYGLLYHESVYFNYLCSLNTDHLADDYFFSNSNWFYKPLWAHEAEQKGLTVSLYSYSINMEKFFRPEDKEPDTIGCNIMSWNHFIVWDKDQEDFWKQYRPKAAFTRVGIIDNGGLAYNHFPKNGKKILSVFDVTPSRTTHHTSDGYATPTSLGEWNFKFLEDIIKLFNNGTWEILWKVKRIPGTAFISNAFINKRLNLVGDNMIHVDPNIAATSLVENSDAVISMPFSSPSVIAKMIGIPSIYYDTTEKVRNTENHGVPVLKSKAELKKWFDSLVVNHIIVDRE